MKIKILLFSLISFIGSGSLLAQEVEHDDMYFTSKDRAKLREARKTNEMAMASVKKTRKDEVEEENLNPTDSYSARNVNPEYTSRSNSQTAKAEDEDYFVNNYQYNNQSNYSNWNNNFNNWYGSSWYRPNYYASSIYAWNSPYYGYYDSWNSPWYDPNWSYNGWSSSFSFHYGNSWNYGWGGSYNYWNRPYCAYNSYYGYGSGFGYGSNWYWNNYRYPNTVVILNNGESAGKGIAYGKRPTRESSIVSDPSNSRSRSNVVGSGRDDVSGGRVSNNGRTQTEYYNRAWRNTDANTNTPARTYDSRSSTQQNRPSQWNNSNSNSNSSWERSSNSSYSPSRSSSSDGGATRTHTPSSSGSGSNGRSRGRD